TVPSSLTIGRWRKRPSTIIAIASVRSVPGAAVSTWRVIRSATGVAGSVPSLMQRSRSRSVITPTSASPGASTTAAPTSDSIMRRAASPIRVSGATETTWVDMTSVSSIISTVLSSSRSREQHGGRLEVALDGLEQARAVRSGARAVVTGQGRVHHRAHHHLAALCRRAVDHAAHGEDGRLGRVDDGREAGHVEHAHVRDGERAALDLSLLQLALAGAAGQVARLACDLAYRERVGPEDHRDDQAVVQGDGHSDVGVGVVDVAAVDVGAVGLGVLHQRHGTRTHDQVVEADLLALLLEQLVQLGAQLHGSSHVDLGADVEVWD